MRVEKGADNVEPDLLVRIHVQLRFELVWGLLWFEFDLVWGLLWFGVYSGLVFAAI